MARKYIGIFMVVMIELYILIVVKIQAENLASTSFAHLAPIMLPHFSELDKAQVLEHQEPEPKSEHQEQKPTLHSCIKKEYEDCKKRKKLISVHNFSYGHCLFNGFIDCQHRFEPSTVIISCLRVCWRHYVIDRHPVAPCLEECYERHVKNNSHNP
jgi:hypothetical protein